MSGKQGIKRRIELIEDVLTVGDDFVDVELVFHESLRAGNENPIILRLRRSEAMKLRQQLGGKDSTDEP